MNGFIILLKRELKSITREKTIMFAILVQFFVASLSSILLVGIMAFYDPSSIAQNTKSGIRIGLIEEHNSPMQGYLRQKGIRVRTFDDIKTAETCFRDGKLDVIMEIPPGQSGVVDMKLVLPEMDAKKTVAMMLLQEPLKNYENYLRFKNGVMLNYEDLGGKPGNTHEFLYSIIVPVLMLFPALIAGSIMIDTVTEEFENKTFDTLAATPVSLKQIFSAKIGAAVVTAVLQVVLWAVLLGVNGLHILNLPQVLMIAFIVAAAVSLIAAIIALYFKDRERAQFAYSIVLVILAGGSYFTGFSPINLITRIASGIQNDGALLISLYALLVLAAGVIFFKLVKKLVFLKQ
ncbi:MAG: ABC transporter permease [Dehalococcoidales bacterium]|nr:ABC transporter permease [Dehalococcoidales bacterium]